MNKSVRVKGGLPDEVTLQRRVFKNSDKRVRRMMLPMLKPAEVEFAGIQMLVDPRDNYTERRIWLDGQPPEMKSLVALSELIEGRNALVLDIGANCGAFTVPLAMAAGAGSRVIAFEPNPVMIGRLGHNVQLNNLGQMVRIEGCALGAEDGEALLNFRVRNFGQATLMPIVEGAQDGAALVPVRALMGYLGAAKNHEICVLKIDIEGAEDAALCPMLEAGAKKGGWLPDAMLVETVHADEWQTDLVGQIEKLGFETRLKVEGNTLFVR